MNEIYWLTRLSIIKTLAVIVLVLAIIAACVTLMVYLEMWFDDDEEEQIKAFTKRWRTTWVCSMLFGLIGVIFIPSEKELLLIYGLGTTVEYIKSSDKAKQLPDKAVDALTRYLDSIENEKQEKE